MSDAVLPPFEASKTTPSWGRSLDHLLYGCEFMAKGKDWETTEIIRRKLQAYENRTLILPSEEEIAAAIGEYLVDDGFNEPDPVANAINAASAVMALLNRTLQLTQPTNPIE